MEKKLADRKMQQTGKYIEYFSEPFLSLKAPQFRRVSGHSCLEQLVHAPDFCDVAIGVKL